MDQVKFEGPIISYFVEVPTAFEAKRVFEMIDNPEEQSKINTILGSTTIFQINFEIIKLNQKINELEAKIKVLQNSKNNLTDRGFLLNDYIQFYFSEIELLKCKLSEKELLRSLFDDKEKLLNSKKDYTEEDYRIARDEILTEIIKVRAGLYKNKEVIKNWCTKKGICENNSDNLYTQFGINLRENKHNSSVSNGNLEEARNLEERIKQMSENGLSFLPSTDEAREILALKLLIPQYTNALLASVHEGINKNMNMYGIPKIHETRVYKSVRR